MSSVCLSVRRDVEVYHTVWNTSKIISRPIVLAVKLFWKYSKLWKTYFNVTDRRRDRDNRGYSKKFGQSLDMPTLPFLQNFSWACVWMDPVNVSAKFASVALAVPQIIVIAVWGWVVNPQSWGRRGRRGSGMAPFERALVTSYRLSIVTFPLSLRVSSERYCRFCSPAHHPTSNLLPQISPCSLWIRWMAYGLRRAKVLF